MKKSGTAKAVSKRRPKIRMCCDRILTGTEKIRAMEAALKESSKNRPPRQPASRRRFGASSMSAPLKMALEAGKKWADGRTLGVYFMDGSATQKAKVKEQAIKWSTFANIKLDFAAGRADGAASGDGNSPVPPVTGPDASPVPAHPPVGQPPDE